VIAAIAALLVMAPSAGATLSMWTTASTMSSPSMTLTINGTNGQISYACPVSVSMSIAAGGSLSMPVGSLTPIGFPCPTIVQGAAWSGTLTALLSGGGVSDLVGSAALPANGMAVSIGLCSFELGGTLTAQGAATPAPVSPLIFSVSSWTMPASGMSALTLTVSGATTACTAFGIVNGNSGSLTGTMSLSPVLVGSLI